MALVTLSGVGPTGVGAALQSILIADDILPGDEPSYQLCKSIFIFHPLGNKMAESPIRLAQSQEREISIPDSPEAEVVEQFVNTWGDLELSRLILNATTQSRIYGIASAALLVIGEDDTAKPLQYDDLWREEITFNLLDPLNTAGSLVTSQDPNSPRYQKWGDIAVNGKTYHRSRTITVMNEESLYIAWTSSAFGFTGRSVYQRALYPMKSFLQTMITDDMVTRKAGLLVARMEQAGSIVDRMMQSMFGVKRNLLREAQTGNVISIGTQEVIEAVNLRNVNESMRESRENIIKNCATAADMPAKLLTQESFVEGFGEGTQDAYAVAQYIDRMRVEMRPQYRWADGICQRMAWTPEFYDGIKRKYPREYEDVSFEAAFQRWRRSFRASWPPLIGEKPSDAVGLQDTKVKAVIAYVQVIGPMLDPENRSRLIQWAVEQANVNEDLFGGSKMLLDVDELEDYLLDQAENPDSETSELTEEEGSGRPAPAFSQRDAQRVVSFLEKRISRGDDPKRTLLEAMIR